MKIKTIIILFFVFCMFQIVGPGATYADKITIKYAHTSPPTTTSVYHKGGQGEARNVEEQLEHPKQRVVEVLKLKHTEGPPRKEQEKMTGDADENPIKAAMSRRGLRPFEKKAKAKTSSFRGTIAKLAAEGQLRTLEGWNR